MGHDINNYPEGREGLVYPKHSMGGRINSGGKGGTEPLTSNRPDLGDVMAACEV
jgi:hypothetical protein